MLSYECDKISREEWEDLVMQFDDATIYQTWSYASIRWGEKSLSHLIIKENNEVIAAAQAAVVKVPLIPLGIAYVPWGPIWQRSNHPRSLEILQQILCALRKEYVDRRGLLLRIDPHLTDLDFSFDQIRPMLESEDFEAHGRPYRTLLLDLSPSIDDLFKNLKKNWRNRYNKAIREGLTVRAGTDDSYFEILLLLYNEMLSRKGFIPSVNILEFRSIQKDLPDSQKMKLMVCEKDGIPIAASIASLLKKKAIAIIGATGDKGLRIGAMHLVRFSLVEQLKRDGAIWYDLGGYNPDLNPGTAAFKEGLGGIDTHHIGKYECSGGPIRSWLIRKSEMTRKALKRK